MPLWNHQEKGADFIQKNTASLLFWGMGSGKSYAAIAGLKKINAQKALIVCPKRVIPTWIDQFDEHAKDEFDLIIPKSGTVKKKAQEVKKRLLNRRDPRPKVVILNYETVWRPGLGHTYKQLTKRKKYITDKGLLRSIYWDIIIADESHKIKAAGSSVSLFFKMLNQNSKKRVALTGTPMPNSPLDLYGQYRFLDPSIFGTSFQRFRMRYAEMGGYENRQVVNFINQEELNKKMFLIADRIRTEDVIKLPGFKDKYIKCELTTAGKKAYNDFLKETILEFQNGEELTAKNAMVKNMRLAQITSGIVKDDSGNEHIVDTSKLETVREFISNIDEPLVIFTRFRAEVIQLRKMIEKMIEDGEKNCGVCQIASDIDERHLFKTGKADIVIVNLQSGGTGLNELVRARYGLYYSIGYALGDYKQSRARIRRPGSDLSKDIIYYHLVVQGTVDEVIKRALDSKENAIDAVVNYFERKAGIRARQKKIA
jgi:SNF2 family DNA or RNA helicase